MKAAAGMPMGRRILVARKRRGFSRAALGAFVGVNGGVVGAWEAGVRQPCMAQTVRLAEGLGIAVALLAEGGAEWRGWCAGAGRLGSPHVLDAPTQYPDALSHDAALFIAEPFREKGARVIDGDERATGAGSPPVSIPLTAADKCRICRKAGRFMMRICEPCWRGEGLDEPGWRRAE